MTWTLSNNPKKAKQDLAKNYARLTYNGGYWKGFEKEVANYWEDKDFRNAYQKELKKAEWFNQKMHNPETPNFDIWVDEQKDKQYRLKANDKKGDMNKYMKPNYKELDPKHYNEIWNNMSEAQKEWYWKNKGDGTDYKLLSMIARKNGHSASYWDADYTEEKEDKGFYDKDYKRGENIEYYRAAEKAENRMKNSMWNLSK